MDYLSLEKFLSKKLEHAKTEVIGKSVLGRFIYAVSFDFESDWSVIIQGSIHARENITTDLILELILKTNNDYYKLKKLGVPNITFVPMVNPDGVELCIKGIKSVKNNTKRRFLLKINGGKNFELFKANANGVDLNTNFDAKWGSGKENKFFPSSNGYVGDSPMSEPEVQALATLTFKIRPCFTISYHSKGQEVYYQFYNKEENLKRDRKIAKIISRTTGYRLINTEGYSSGGYKDWCIKRFNIPAVTIEVGKDSFKHPIQKDKLLQIYKRNKNIIKNLTKILKEIKNGNAKDVYAGSFKAGTNRI